MQAHARREIVISKASTPENSLPERPVCVLFPAPSLKVAGTPILGHFLCSISLYLQNYAVVGIYKINFDCSENNLH